MLGRFLELALVTTEVTDAWQQYQGLGFEAADTGDIWSHAYGVVACRNLALGFHAEGGESPSLVFVRPEVSALHRELQERGVAVEQARLGSDVFNELWLREPGGVALRVIEARSFSPPRKPPERTGLGRFHSISLPCRDPDATRDFWTSLGFECRGFESPWEGFGISGTPLATHPHRVLPEPALLFEPDASHPPGLTPGRALSPLRGTPHALWRDATGLVLVTLDPAAARV